MSSLYQIYWKAQVDGKYQSAQLASCQIYLLISISQHQRGQTIKRQISINTVYNRANRPLTQQSHKCSPPICQIKNFITKVTEVLFLSIKSARSSLQATSSYTIQEVNLQYINLYIQRERVQHKEALTDFAQATCYSISGGIHKINAM